MPKPPPSMRVKKPPFRKLRVFAFDPSLDLSLETVMLNTLTVEIPWEKFPDGREPDEERGPAPGPVGEYIEVVDYDPGSGAWYEPVDLNNSYLLSQNGYPPSDGNPQFHQQMVYAVAMKTIKNFERALGRLVLWDSYRDPRRREPDRFVRRLRIYPHAMREANAYYSPQRKSLLFGYFPSWVDPSSGLLPGGIVFTCLSHDIIVHEITHALLDGMHRRYIEASNPDQLAFHEAFADIVAIFQHFSFEDVVRHQISRTGGRLASRPETAGEELPPEQNLLADLAQEFGRAIGRSEALRSAIGKKPNPARLAEAVEPHDRGAVLVAAVFDAFLSIYRKRTQDLLRMSGIGAGAAEGGVHPDLVNRLAHEASKTAEHILSISIRALDYLPPVDITFGDYLRALITADSDLVPADPYQYRVAFIEAFRKYGIYPQDVRSLSEHSLLWDGPAKEDVEKPQCLSFARKLRRLVQGWDLEMDRERLFNEMIHARVKIKKILGLMKARRTAALKGLNLKFTPTFEVHSVRPVRRVGPNGQLLVDLLVEITQRRPGFFTERAARAASPSGKPDFWFRGGCTLLIDMRTSRLRYCIYKDIGSRSRYERQRAYMAGLGSLRATYFSDTDRLSDDAALRALHSD